MTIQIVDDIQSLDYNKVINKDLAGISASQHNDRFSHWWAWAESVGANGIEYLMPQMRVDTKIAPFSFEARFARNHSTEPTRSSLDALAPWAYQIEMGSVSTLGVRRDPDWKYHRYRASLLAETAATIAGDHVGDLSVLDVACHCGVFSLAFADLGFKNVRGLDLRIENIRQAEFLAKIFNVPKVGFGVENARNISKYSADVVFCGGLLYHVVFPMELLKDLYDITSEFLVLDSLCHKYPLSAFHLVCQKDVGYSAEGEFHYEFHPTYRALCDGLIAVGFKTIYEIVGDLGHEVPNYSSGNVRSFVAVKNEGGVFKDFMAKRQSRPA